jgi:hypothetical protein
MEIRSAALTKEARCMREAFGMPNGDLLQISFYEKKNTE